MDRPEPEPDKPLEPATVKSLGGAPGMLAEIWPTCHKSQAMFAAYTNGVLVLSCRKCRRAVVAFKIAEE